MRWFKNWRLSISLAGIDHELYMALYYVHAAFTVLVSANSSTAILFTIFNSTQGFFIFLFFLIAEKSSRDQAFKRLGLEVRIVIPMPFFLLSGSKRLLVHIHTFEFISWRRISLAENAQHDNWDQYFHHQFSRAKEERR